MAQGRLGFGFMRLAEGFAINGDNAANCDKEVEKWLENIGLKGRLTLKSKVVADTMKPQLLNAH